MNWWTGLLTHFYTPLGTTTTALTLIYTLYKSPQQPLNLFPACCLLQPFPSNGFYQWRFFSFPRSDTLVTATHAEPSTQLQRHLLLASLAEFNSTADHPLCTGRIEDTVSNNNYCCRGVFTNPLLRNGLHNLLVLFLCTCMLRALLSNGRCLHIHRLATGL
jgi:hypothetical protein